MNKPDDNQLGDYAKEIKKVRKIGSPWDAYNIGLKNTNSIDKIATNLYVEHFLMAALLDAFVWKEEQDFKALNEALFNYIPEHFLWDVSVAKVNLIIAKTIRLGYIESFGNDTIPKFKITQLGIEILQNQTFQSLAATSFFNYRTHQLNKLFTKINIY